MGTINHQGMKVESKQQQITRPVAQVYGTLSNFENFTPIVADKVEGWEATADACSFMAKGFRVALAIVEKQENVLVKVGPGEGGTPFPFTFWLQFKEVDTADTRIKIVLDAELNMMMKMMIGGKLQTAVDQIAQQIADAFNGKMNVEMTQQK